MDFEQSWGALEQHSIENANWGGVKNIDSPCTQLPFDVHSVDHNSYMPVAACSADTASLRRFRFQKKNASFRWPPAGFCPQFFQIEAHPRKHRPFLATLGATMTIPAKMQWFAHVGCITRARIVTVIYFFLLPAAVATSVADTITRVTMDFHPQLGNLRIKLCLMVRNYTAKKNENSDERPVLSRNHFHVFFWHQRFGNKPIYCWESWCRICVVANPHETHQQKPSDPIPITLNPNITQISLRKLKAEIENLYTFNELWPTNCLCRNILVNKSISGLPFKFYMSWWQCCSHFMNQFG